MPRIVVAHDGGLLGLSVGKLKVGGSRVQIVRSKGS